MAIEIWYASKKERRKDRYIAMESVSSTHVWCLILCIAFFFLGIYIGMKYKKNIKHVVKQRSGFDPSVRISTDVDGPYYYFNDPRAGDDEASEPGYY